MLYAQISTFIPYANGKWKPWHKDKKEKEARLSIVYPDSVYFGNDYPVENFDYDIEIFTGGSWVAFSSGSTDASGLIIFDIMPNEDYRIIGTSWAVVWWGNGIEFDETNCVQTIEVQEKDIHGTFKYDMVDTPLAIGVEIELYMMNGTWQLVGTMITDSNGLAQWDGLIVGLYSFTNDYLQETDVVGGFASIQAGIVLLPSIFYNISLYERIWVSIRASLQVVNPCEI